MSTIIFRHSNKAVTHCFVTAHCNPFKPVMLKTLFVVLYELRNEFIATMNLLKDNSGNIDPKMTLITIQM